MSQVRHRIAVRPYDGIWSRYIGFIYEQHGASEFPMRPTHRSVIRGRHKEKIIAEAHKRVAHRCVEIAHDEALRAQETSHPLGTCT